LKYAIRTKKLSETAIKKWRSLLFVGSKAVRAGKYRKGDAPMQVVSGAIGREIVHYEAPPSKRVPPEMKNFVAWYNAFEINDIADVLIKTSIAHLYFESIYSFEDGNGRIGRAIADVIVQAQTEAAQIVRFSIQKARFFDKFRNELNERELKAVNRMFEASYEGFEGGMTAKKYMSITLVSKATATRDLQHLSEIGAFNAQGGGQNVHYFIESL
jgi:Fic family protein